MNKLTVFGPIAQSLKGFYLHVGNNKLGCSILANVSILVLSLWVEHVQVFCTGCAFVSQTNSILEWKR
jgi:hypothetical protein